MSDRFLVRQELESFHYETLSWYVKYERVRYNYNNSECCEICEHKTLNLGGLKRETKISHRNKNDFLTQLNNIKCF